MCANSVLDLLVVRGVRRRPVVIPCNCKEGIFLVLQGGQLGFKQEMQLMSKSADIMDRKLSLCTGVYDPTGLLQPEVEAGTGGNEER